jgi:hypothetical protein
MEIYQIKKAVLAKQERPLNSILIKTTYAKLY